MSKTKIEPIETLGRNTDLLTVQKSIPLFSLWRSPLTLPEFKILDTYLARIDSHKPDKRTVTFHKGELENLLGVKRIRIEELDERLTHLCSSIRIDDKTSKNNRFTRIALFEKAVAEQDDHGIWQVELTASPSAMKYFFNIENLGYLRYKLRCITALTSRYSYIMFTYLEHNRFRKSWDVSLTELKLILSCDKVETYTAFKEFNKQVLKRAQAELQEKTECKYTYTPIKNGRSVVAIHFEVQTLSKLEKLETDDDNQITIDQWQESVADDRPLWHAPLVDFGLNQLQIDEIGTILPTIPDHKFSQKEESWYTNENRFDFKCFDYLTQKISEIKRRDAEKPIKNKFAYLLKMIKQDAVTTEI